MLEDERDAPAEIQLSLQKQLNDLNTQLRDLQTQLIDAYKVEIEGKIIYTQLSAIICICRHKNTLTCTSIRLCYAPLILLSPHPAQKFSYSSSSILFAVSDTCKIVEFPISSLQTMPGDFDTVSPAPLTLEALSPMQK